MGSRALLLLLSFLLCLPTATSSSNDGDDDDTSSLPGSASSHQGPISTHHSLFHPFDTSLLHWRIGGSTVTTSSFIRLTPNSQSKKGWLFNLAKLDSKQWEMEIHFSVKATYHIGGDGMAFWVLTPSMHPSMSNNHHNWLAGSLFGMREDFKGFGVILDTYDNDAKRDNPAIFVLKQSNNKNSSTQITWDHDSDFKKTMVKEAVTDEFDFVCTSEYRNRDLVKLILRYVDETLHVYINTGKKYVLCLAVKMGIDTHGMHFAISAMTGQVADTHEIYMISTRYLTDADAHSIDDRKLKKAGHSRSWFGGFTRVIFWFTVIICSFILIYDTAIQFWTIRRLYNENVCVYDFFFFFFFFFFLTLHTHKFS